MLVLLACSSAEGGSGGGTAVRVGWVVEMEETEESAEGDKSPAGGIGAAAAVQVFVHE